MSRFRAVAGPLAAALAVLAPVAAMAAGAPDVGQAAPALVVAELNGQPFDLATLRGKVVIVNFWATWCSPCRAEMPALDAFYRKYHEQGVELLGLSIDDSHDRGDVEKVMRKFSYPAALMSAAKTNGFGMPLAVPMTYIIDSTGVVRARILAGKTTVTEQSLAQTVEPLLSQAKAPASAAKP
jgi:thiol-disulfide isomerase/thioredoxin